MTHKSLLTKEDLLHRPPMLLQTFTVAQESDEIGRFGKESALNKIGQTPFNKVLLNNFHIKILFFYFVCELIIFLVCNQLQVSINGAAELAQLDFFRIVKLFIIFLVLLICVFFKQKTRRAPYFINKNKISNSLMILQPSTRMATKGEGFFLLSLSLIALSSILYSKNLLAIYLSLEIYGISAYTLTGYSKNPKGIRAAGKYYLLGSLGSFLILLGILFLYKIYGHLDFEILQRSSSLHNPFSSQSSLLIIKLFFLGIFLKLGLAPLHFWIVEIYSNTPFIFFSYFLTIPKIVILAFFIKWINFVFNSVLAQDIGIFLSFLAFINIIIGTFVPIGKRDLKDLLTLSSLSNFGYALLAVSSYSFESSLSAMIFYMIYNSVIFILLQKIYIMREKRSFYEHTSLDKIKNLNRDEKILFILILLSLSGLPPFSIFFGKLILLLSLIKVKGYLGATILLLFSSIGSYYYIHLLQIILIEDKKNQVHDEVKESKTYYLARLSEVGRAAANSLIFFLNGLFLTGFGIYYL